MSQSIDRLFEAAIAANGRDPSSSRTAKLFRDGVDKMVKKLAEESVETGIEAIHGRHIGVIQESADVIYQLVVLWAALGISPNDIWNEMDRRERLYGIAEKLPKTTPSGEPTRIDIPVDRITAKAG
jgi:phosphoribosyl-ATP pyrophosphohydrolase